MVNIVNTVILKLGLKLTIQNGFWETQISNVIHL